MEMDLKNCGHSPLHTTSKVIDLKEQDYRSGKVVFTLFILICFTYFNLCAQKLNLESVNEKFGYISRYYYILNSDSTIILYNQSSIHDSIINLINNNKCTSNYIEIKNGYSLLYQVTIYSGQDCEEPPRIFNIKNCYNVKFKFKKVKAKEYLTIKNPNYFFGKYEVISNKNRILKLKIIENYFFEVYDPLKNTKSQFFY